MEGGGLDLEVSRKDETEREEKKRVRIQIDGGEGREGREGRRVKSVMIDYIE